MDADVERRSHRGDRHSAERTRTILDLQAQVRDLTASLNDKVQHHIDAHPTCGNAAPEGWGNTHWQLREELKRGRGAR